MRLRWLRGRSEFRRQRPFASHTLILVSAPTVASRRPSRLQQRSRTSLPGVGSLRRMVPVPPCRSTIVHSSPAEARSWPVGSQATHQTGPSCPTSDSGGRAAPARRSQIKIRSPLAAANRRPASSQDVALDRTASARAGGPKPGRTWTETGTPLNGYHVVYTS